MLKLTKKKLLDLANEGKTLWDLYEILQVYNEREYNEYLREVFGDNYEEYNIFNDQVNLNHFKYRVLNNHSTDNIAINDLLKMLDEGKSKIDFMRLFGVITTNKLYKEIKKIFEYSDDIEGFEAFKRRLIKNTKKIMSQNDNTNLNKKHIVYLYATDYLVQNINNEDFNIPKNKEAYILNISYYLKKFGNCHLSNKIMNVCSKNKNINYLSILPFSTEDKVCCTDDIEHLINTALNLKMKGKTPIIVTFNRYNYIKCLSYNIYFCSEASNEILEESICNKMNEKENKNLPYICFDPSYILKLIDTQEIENMLYDTTTNKIIFSEVLDFTLEKMINSNTPKKYTTCFYDIAFSILVNPTMHFIQSTLNFYGSSDFDKQNYINNILNFSLEHPNIKICTDDFEIMEYATYNKIEFV